MKILLFRIGYFGDMVVALPVLRALRLAHPAARIVLLTNVSGKIGRIGARDVVAPRLVDEIIEYDSGVLEQLQLIRVLRKARFDEMLYLAPRARSGWRRVRDILFFRLVGIPRLLGFATIGDQKPRDVDGTLRRVERESDFLLARAGLSAPAGDTLLLEADEHDEALAWLAQHGLDRDERPPRRLLAVAPWSAMRSKNWPLDRFANVARTLVQRFDVHPIIVCGPDQSQAATDLIATIGRGSATAGALSIRAQAALLRHCDLFVGVDTGSMHLAAAAGVPCVVIAAAIDAPGRWDPVGTDHRVLRHSVPCEGCELERCPFENRCVNLIDEHRVLSAADDVLGRAALR